MIFNHWLIFFLQNYCKSFSNSYNSLHLDLICLTVQHNGAANYTGTVHKLQAGRLKSDKRNDEDRHQDFSKKQGICQYHGIGSKKTRSADILLKRSSNALNDMVFFFVWTIYYTYFLISLDFNYCSYFNLLHFIFFI